MAAKYFYRKNGSDIGPLSFQNLVGLVASGEIESTDLVRRDWENDWLPAGSVVGLFHHARRESITRVDDSDRQQRPAAEPPQPERPRTEPQPHNPLTNPAQASPTGSNWRQRLREVEARRPAAPIVRRPSTSQTKAAEPDASSISLAISIATEQAARKDAERLPRKTFSSAWMRSGLRFAFRLMCAGAVIGFAAMAIEDWSQSEQLRFPTWQSSHDPGQFFPVWGRCTSSEYTILFADSVIVAAAIGYWIARVVETLCDDA